MKTITNRAELLEAVKKDGRALEYAGEALKNDRDIVLEAVKNDGSALAYASEALKNDREFFLEVFNNNARALEYAGEELKNDREFFFKAVKEDASALEYASEALKNDREIVLEAFNNNARALEFAGKEFQNDQDIIKIFNIENREIVLEAVKKDGRALKYASDKFIVDREIVLEAVKQNGGALKYAGEELKNDREIVLAAVKQDGKTLQFAAKGLREDKDIIRKAQYSFKTISIGKQEWLDSNLAVDTFRNGDAIPEAKTKAAWLKAGKEGKPAWCFYNNDPSNETKYGKLYNWYAVNDPRGLAPDGYQVASEKDWQVLKTFLDDDNNLGAGNKLKSQVGWDNPPIRRYSYSKVNQGQGMYINVGGGDNYFNNVSVNTDGNGLDEFGFKALPGGIYKSSFEEAGDKGFWWSKSEKVIAYSMNNEDGEPIEIPKVTGGIPMNFFPPFGTSQLLLVDDPTKDLNKINIDKTNGLSVRCIKA